MDKGKKRRREIEKLEKDVAELRRAAGEQTDQETRENLERLQEQVRELMREFAEGAESASVARRAESWERVQLARHAQRPYTLDYVKHLMDMFSELHGDRGFADDAAMVGGMASFRGQPVMVIGQQKGRDTKQKLARNFGMPKPEGYRKALRLMRLAAKFKRPILSFVDTPGAYPGIDAEERGEAEAIARNLLEMARLPVPIIVTITGEGGSGGALAIAVGDRVNMLENAIYSVISPEGCASIMWRDASQAATAAEALRITAPMLKEMGIIDEVVPEPEGGAHQNHAEAARLLGDVLERQLEELARVNTEALLAARYEKFRRMGNRFLE